MQGNTLTLELHRNRYKTRVKVKDHKDVPIDHQSNPHYHHVVVVSFDQGEYEPFGITTVGVRARVRVYCSQQAEGRYASRSLFL
jgi:hypothetical protein